MLSAFFLSLIVDALAHGRSAEMVTMLNAPVPDWMSLAEPIKVEPVNEQSLPAPESFGPRSGGATNSGNRVQIPERGIEFQVDYPIVYTGNNAEGLGVSLSPAGTKLIVSSGTGPHLYEIASNGAHREIPIRLPDVTYDDGPKGFITKWSWAGNDVLIGRSEITDERGHELLEVRYYLFYLIEQALARLNLSALNLPDDTAGLEISGIGHDLESLQIKLGDLKLAAKVDLKAPPRLLARPDSASKAETQPIEQPPFPEIASGGVETPPTPNEQSASSTPWLVVVVAMMVSLGLLWLLFKKQK